MRLWQRLFLAFAVLSAFALASFVGWQQLGFRRGFLDYLNGVELERLRAAAPALAARYGEAANWDFLRADPDRLAGLLDPGALWRRPHPPGPPPDLPRGPGRERADTGVPGPAPAGAPPWDRIDRGGFEAGRPPFPPRPGGDPPLPWVHRVTLSDADGAFVAGRPDPPDDAAVVEVSWDGAVVGRLRLARLPRLIGGLDTTFAAAQRRDALIAGGSVLAVALLLALALARRLLAPIRALAQGTLRLAAGDYAFRVDARRRDEFGALAADFNHLAASLESHREQRRRWGADIAHELRTPISVLRGEIQALQDGVRPVGAEALASLHAECDRLTALVEDLYQLALTDAGALEYRFETLALAPLLQEAAELQRAAFADAGLALDVALAEAAPVRADARRIAQLIDNLLGNARRYTDAPGRIRLGLRGDGQYVRVSVDDTAPGVPDAALPRLFDRLYRVEDSRDRASGGAGLGLAICRAIVEAHGGRIEALHSPLGGLRVEIVLPAADSVR
ncbi:MAG: ATP-binding protein [Dokdonella sp.]|nr:ATP-binding protein [Dokdonella sp.]